MASEHLSDAARFLAAVGDANSDGMTSDELAAYMEANMSPGDIIRLRVGCVALIATIDKLMRRPKRTLPVATHRELRE